MRWADFQAAAPELARPGRERFEQAGVALLGTLRRDGTPRISPVEPYFAAAELVFGALAWSLKAHDLLRDPRCVLHSAVTAPDAGEEELKLYGRAAELRDPALRGSRADAWWVSHPPEAARVFTLSVEQAALVAWDVEAGEMTTLRWSPEDGVTKRTRRYP